MNMLVGLMEKGMLPDAVIRRGIRRLLRKRLHDECHGDTEVECEPDLVFDPYRRRS
jgi:hypothetical protein